MIYISDIQKFIEGVKHLINEAIRKAPYDKTYQGKVTNVNGSKYSVKINNTVYDDTPALASGVSVGDLVRVVFPQNNPVLRYIDNAGQGGSGGDGNYNSLSNKPKINNVEVSGNKPLSAFGINLGDKYDKTGGVISGDVDINGLLDMGDNRIKLSTPARDEDYPDDMIYIEGKESIAYGQLLNVGQVDGSVTKTVIIDGVRTPQSDNHAANKAYVDSKLEAMLIGYGLINENMSVTIQSNFYTEAKDEIDNNKIVLIKLFYPTPAEGILWMRFNKLSDTTATPNLIFSGVNTKQDGFQYNCVVTIHSDNTATFSESRLLPMTYSQTDNVEVYAKRADGSQYMQDITTNATSNTMPVRNANGTFSVGTATANSEVANFGDIKHWVDEHYKPVVLYTKDDGLLVSGTITQGHSAGVGLSKTGASKYVENNQWNIEGMDLTPYKKLRIVAVRDSVNTASTFEVMLPLDYNVLTDATNGNLAVASGSSAAFGDRNRINYIICAARKAQGQFAFCDGYSLYGTAATTISAIHVVKIEGYKI